MFREITATRQAEGEPRRRWFSDPGMDLYVWYGEDESVIRFQICYDKGPDEKALTWSVEDGISHRGVDDGEGRVLHMKSSPILTGDVNMVSDNVAKHFAEIAGTLEHQLYEFIMQRLAGKYK